MARELTAKHPGLGPEEIAEQDARQICTTRRPRTSSGCSTRWRALPRKGQPPRLEKPVSAWVLVAANLVPLAGVLFWGWDAFALIALFWMENVVIGVFFVLRMLALDPRDPALWAGKLFMVPFFCFHYGMFTAIHGVFVFYCWAASATTCRACGCSSRRRAPPTTTACGCRSARWWRATCSRSCGTTSTAASSGARSWPS